MVFALFGKLKFFFETESAVLEGVEEPDMPLLPRICPRFPWP